MPHNLTFVTALLMGTCFSYFLNRLTDLSLRQTSLLALFVVGISWVVYRSFIYPFYLSPLRHIPTIPGCPLWGHTIERFRRERGLWEREWHRKYGNVIRFFSPFGFETLSVTDLDSIREMTTTNPYRYQKPASISIGMRNVLGNGLLFVDGDEHARQRKTLTPAFSHSSIRELEHIFWEKGLTLCHLLTTNTSPDRTQSVLISPLLNRATLDIIGKAAFGYDVDSLRNPGEPLAEAYSSLFKFDLVSNIILLWRILSPQVRYLPVEINRTLTKVRQDIKVVVHYIVSNRLKSGEKSILERALRYSEELKERDMMSITSIEDQVMMFLAVGHESTSTAVAWTLDLLAKHPDIQNRLRCEILGALPNLPELDAEELANYNLESLPYLNKVCQESLRYLPTVPMTIRECMEDCKLAGHHVPKGTWVLLVPNAINHLSSYWGEDADTFDPDRWDHLPRSWCPAAYLTFLQGPRGCIGRKFAETEMKVLLCCLLARFSFERDAEWPDQALKKEWRVVHRPRDGIKLLMKAL
ncbi:Cytochrome P450 monooxygenase ALT8-like protein [Cladobotryum mycophilum]|uniref:Cytochrome P450 monooxygenase ALT8-like protein n=1 Tax=Cladobotryum mycophilum TaxID=491253 RepID=A0ABR0SRP1_9HYPO